MTCHAFFRREKGGAIYQRSRVIQQTSGSMLIFASGDKNCTNVAAQRQQ
jgi:hypothetical protein